MEMTIDQQSFQNGKPHFRQLNGLRGIAAIMVVLFHLIEIFFIGDPIHQWVNHGYLAVDFFFLLSGYVISYAYDDRWNSMKTGSFFKRRIIRLHPLIVFSMLLGAASFYLQFTPRLYGLIPATSGWMLLIVTFMSMAMIPIPVAMDIRGWGEMYPLNGPAWSLFFEYLAYLAYGLFLRRLSNRLLIVLVFLSGIALVHQGLTSSSGTLAGGWTLDATHIKIGMTRLCFPFVGGMLMQRSNIPIRKFPQSFLLASMLLISVLCLPRIGDADAPWMNSMYEFIVVMIGFPFILFLGSSDQFTESVFSKICIWLGDLSYPIYITHQLVVYFFMAWVFRNKLNFVEALPLLMFTFIFIIIFSWACFKWIDKPIREWLTKKWLLKSNIEKK